jgi:hypothetical protein
MFIADFAGTDRLVSLNLIDIQKELSYIFRERSNVSWQARDSLRIEESVFG